MDINIHEKRMSHLISFTRSNSSVEPYGCSIYTKDDTLLVSVTGDKKSPINHAEVLAINECAQKYPQIAWDTLTLYTTGEPCCMCASACCWANLNYIIYGTNIPYMINLWGIESTERAAAVIQSHPKKPILLAGVCEAECNSLFLECKDKFADTWNANRWTLNK